MQRSSWKINRSLGSNIIEYYQKYFKCIFHNIEYNTYCENCKKDLYIECEKEDSTHKVIYYGNILTHIDTLNNLKTKIDEYENQIKEIIFKLNDFMVNIDIYYNINYNLINNYVKNYSVI